VKLKFTISHKLLIVIAIVLLAAGAGKLVCFNLKPLDTVIFSINNLIKSAGFEQDLQMTFRADGKLWNSQSIADMINDTLITAHYMKTRNASGLDFTLSSQSSQNTVLKGSLYTDSGLTVLTLNDKTFYSRKNRQSSITFLSSLSTSLKNYKPVFKYQTGYAIPINDYGRPSYMAMDSFSTIISGDGCNDFLGALFSGFAVNDSSISINQIPPDSTGKISAIFQIDDLFRLRSIHAEISVSGASAAVDLNTRGIGGKISLARPDISNGADISDFSEDETGSLLKGFFESLAGGN